MTVITHFQNWYIKLKIPEIELKEIPNSLKVFWIDYFNKLNSKEKKLIIDIYEAKNNIRKMD